MAIDFNMAPIMEIDDVDVQAAVGVLVPDLNLPNEVEYHPRQVQEDIRNALIAINLPAMNVLPNANALGDGPVDHKIIVIDSFEQSGDTTEIGVHSLVHLNLTMLQAVMHLMTMKLKYNFSNQCYNDIVKLIIDLISMKHNMPKDLYQSKKIVASLGMNFEKINVCKKIACCSGGRSRTMANVCTVLGPNT
jgi:hypothetical protein